MKRVRTIIGTNYEVSRFIFLKKMFKDLLLLEVMILELI
jgi:hypothetical protein